MTSDRLGSSSLLSKRLKSSSFSLYTSLIKIEIVANEFCG
jgi:hypothetical protein